VEELYINNSSCYKQTILDLDVLRLLVSILQAYNFKGQEMKISNQNSSKK